MEKSNLWAIVIVAIVVAVIASLVTVSITGKAIWRTKTPTVTYKGVLDMLNKCEVRLNEKSTGSTFESCDITCTKDNPQTGSQTPKTCILASYDISDRSNREWDNGRTSSGSFDYPCNFNMTIPLIHYLPDIRYDSQFTDATMYVTQACVCCSP